MEKEDVENDENDQWNELSQRRAHPAVDRISGRQGPIREDLTESPGWSVNLNSKGEEDREVEGNCAEDDLQIEKYCAVSMAALM